MLSPISGAGDHQCWSWSRFDHHLSHNAFGDEFLDSDWDDDWEHAGAASTTVTIGNAFSLSGAGIVSLGASGNTITISASTAALPSVVTSLNGSAGSLSISAGAGIGIGQANSTITISASNQTSSLSYVQSLNGSSGQLSISAGANIGTGQAGSTITISASSYSTLVSITSALGGATSGTVNTASSSAFALVAGSNITLSQNSTNPAITIIGPSPAGGGGNVIQGSNLATSTGTIVLSGSNITISTGASSIQIIGPVLPSLSFIENMNMQEVEIPLVSGSGTASQTMFGSSLFLDRLFVPGVMHLSEVDLAMSFAFATTSVSGSMNRSFVVYSFVNSTSLASLISASLGISFTGSNTTTGASTAFSQVAGAWTVAGGVIVPMTFASSSIAAGDYVVGNLLAFSLASSASASLFGVVAKALTSQSISAVTAITSATLGALSSGGLAAVSALTGTTNVTVTSMAVHAGSALTALTQNATNNVSWFVSRASSASTSVASATSSFTFVEAPFVGSLGTTAGSIITGSTAATAFSAGGLSAGSFVGTSGSLSAVTNVGVAALGSTTVNNLSTSLPGFNYLGASSVLTGGLFWQPFDAGLMSTGGIPANITLTTGTTAGLTVYGSTAMQQPWVALIGA